MTVVTKRRRSCASDRGAIGKIVSAARGRTISLSVLVVLLAMLGCGGVMRVGSADVPTATPNVETTLSKRQATLTETDLAPWKGPTPLTRDPATIREATEVPQKPEAAETSVVAVAESPQEVDTMPSKAAEPPTEQREAEATLAETVKTPPPAPALPPEAAKFLPSTSLVGASEGPTAEETPEAATNAWAQKEPTEPEGPPASVTFVSSPPGATVVVNGSKLPGRTPLAGRPVPPGRSKIEFRLDGYEPVSTQRRWEPGEVDRVNVGLRRQPVRLTVISTPPGATVWLNRRRLIEPTPINDLEVPPGPGRIELFLRGYEPVVVERTWKPNTADRVHVRLQRPSARVTFVSSPPGATVSVNGNALPGETPMQDVQIRPGPATIEFRLDGHAPVIAEREWKPDAVDRMAVRLQPLWVRVAFASTPSGATVKVNGRVLPEKTPIADMSVSSGRSTIEFDLEGHEPAIIERDWRPGTSDRVEATLSPILGRVRFETDKKWESLKIDGKTVAISPKEWRELSPGRYSAQALSGDEVAHAEFAVLAGRDTVIRLLWRRGKPDSDRYVFLPAARVPLGLEDYAKENPPRMEEVPAFWMSRTEVTVAEYGDCVEAGACEQPKSGENCNWGLTGREQHPINCVSAKQAEAYAVWLSDRDGLPYELPTADQWERAARGATGRRYPWGNDPPSGQCNSCDRSCPFNHFKDRDFDDGWELTAPVGSLNECKGPEGIMDQVGNVAEWCRDETPGGGYGARGGSWGQIGAFLDPSFPGERRMAAGDQTIGFRLVVPHIPGF